MEPTNKKKTEKAQGAETATAEDRNPSLSYTIKSLGGNIKKLEKLAAVTNEELEKLRDIHKRLVMNYIGYELGIK